MGVSYKAAAAVAVLTLAAAASAQGGRAWQGIGKGTATPDSGSVAIPARGGPRDRELMICAEGRAIRLNVATLRFEGGATQSLKIGERLADGGCTGGKGFSGRNHSVESIEVAYDKATLAGGTARIELFVR
ncbi:MAG TPA: hypothetical protein VFQ67_14825 [Allosphingosinicella sp.]|jgi:hypothetical protein|nr:hypothetical protein [Allosphingosinicella sp.]